MMSGLARLWRAMCVGMVIAASPCAAQQPEQGPPSPDVTPSSPPAAPPAASTVPSTPPGLKNADFMEGPMNGGPVNWIVMPSNTPARVVEDERSPTKRSMQVGPVPAGQTTGNMLQQFDATPFRGKRIIVQADIRLAEHESTTQLRNARAQMWVRVDRAERKRGFFDNMNDRPIRGLRAMSYQRYAISGLVDDDAEMISLGIMVHSGTVAHVARFAVFSAPADAQADAAARPVAGRELDNLVALAKLYGYVRYFHPSDEAAGADWERWLIGAIEDVEGAADPTALAASLTRVAATVGPTVQVWAGDVGAAPAVSATAPDVAAWNAWRHFGVDVKAQIGNSIYNSERVRSTPDKKAADVPALGTMVVKALGGGVSCRVPLTVALDAAGATVPRAEGALPAPKRPEWWSPNGGDRTARLAGVMIAWNVFQHFYPYFDRSDADWPAVLRGALTSAAQDADQWAYLRTLQRLVAELDDGHGNVTPLNVPRPGPLNAIFTWVGDKLIVSAVGEGVQDLQRGDVVAAIAGAPTSEWYAESRTRVSAATEQWARWRTSSDHTFFGWASEPVELTVLREGKEVRVSPPRRTSDQSLKEARPASGEEVAPGIVYFNLDGAELPAWRDALPKMQAAKGLVLDMRGYPGQAGVQMLRHLTTNLAESAKWIIPVSTLPDREGVVWHESGRWRLQPAEPHLGGNGQNVVILTDGRAISYAESCMGVVEAYGLAKIVGGATAGTNGNINPFTVCGGYYISWTGMKVLKHDGSAHHGVGILPTAPAVQTIEGITAGRDELLEAAIKAAGGN